MEKDYLFKGYREGRNNKTQKPYKMLELHDPLTLENTAFFLRDDQDIPLLSSLKLKDKVIATHGITTFGGQPKLTVEAIRKAV